MRCSRSRKWRWSSLGALLVFLVLIQQSGSQPENGRAIFQNNVRDDKISRMFSLFSVVTFPNSECTTTGANPMNGVCQTSRECSDRGGAASGNCASSFGVCCMYMVTACDSTISNNVTYIQNENFPAGFTTMRDCSYRIEGASDICQIRLDFETGIFIGPQADGTCVAAADSDLVTFTSPGLAAPPNLCGILTGSHVYIETSRENPGATLDINTGASTASRMWKIKVSQIECSNPGAAPTDCVQYFTGTGGIITSFNQPKGMIKNQRYDICIRQNDGFCSFVLNESGTTDDPFQLSGNADNAATGTECLNNANGHKTAYIEVTTTPGVLDRFCGKRLNPVNGNTMPGTVMSSSSPFRIGVYALNQNQADLGGFNLRYTQVPCGARLP